MGVRAATAGAVIEVCWRGVMRHAWDLRGVCLERGLECLDNRGRAHVKWLTVSDKHKDKRLFWHKSKR